MTSISICPKRRCNHILQAVTSNLSPSNGLPATYTYKFHVVLCLDDRVRLENHRKKCGTC